jgi:putative GTP pyrophosphokinase
VTDLTGEYSSMWPLHDAFTNTCKGLLEALLDDGAVAPFAVEGRTKTMESFAGKINREGKAGKYKSLSDITDLSGIRIIAYLQEDCDKIGDIIQRDFTIDATNSVRKEDELDPDKFGYLSTHFVVSLPESRIALREFARFADLKAEIQVRTLLQHTWAAIDWKFRYKEEREAPKELRRRLFRISALLEAADNEFSSVKVAIDAIAKQHETSISNNDLDILVDTESLRSYLKSSDAVNGIVSAARGAGLIVPSPGGNLLIARLSRTAHLLGLKTVKQFDDSLRVAEPRASEFFRYIVENREIVPGSSEIRANVSWNEKTSWCRIESRTCLTWIWQSHHGVP